MSVYNKDNVENLDIELSLLLQAVNLKYGYDFSNYSKAHLKRRILHRLSLSDLQTISELQNKIIWNKTFYKTFLQDLSINVTEMFRDPEFYLNFRLKVIPELSTYAHIKIWHAGCSTGEEVYSLAIMLQEEGILHKTRIYATDFNKQVLETAKKGIYSRKEMELYAGNYLESGGKCQLSDYYTSKYGVVLLDQALAKNIVFADHNLVTDGIFAEVHLVFCRNVLIYFDKTLQSRVLELFTKSLTKRGFLCLGTKESLQFSKVEKEYETVDKAFKIYKKMPLQQ